MDTSEVAGLNVSSIKKQELIGELRERLQNNQASFITTPYSEFLYHAMQDPEVAALLNQSDFAVPDGIGIFWARKFLEVPLTAKTYYGKIIQALWQVIYTLFAIVLYPSWIK